jgi:phage recombination protein Bet
MGAIATKVVNQQIDNWQQDQITLIKEYMAPGISDGELSLFEMACKRTGLDPFIKQIYPIMRWDGRLKRNKMTIQVGIDGFRAVAQRSKKYNSNKTFWCGKDGVWKEVWLEDVDPAAAMTIVTRTDAKGEFVGVATWKSYSPTKENMSFLWGGKADIMIGKCSEALALRKAFPAELGGLYIPEEMQVEDIQPVSIEQTNSGTDNVRNILKARKNIKEQRQNPSQTVEGEVIETNPQQIASDVTEESEDFKKFSNEIATCNTLLDLKAIRAKGKDGKLTAGERKVLGERYKHKEADLEAAQSEW